MSDSGFGGAGHGCRRPVHGQGREGLPGALIGCLAQVRER